MQPSETVVVVPCFNEASRLDPDAFVEALAADPSVGLTFVDDGSSDGTGRVLEQLGKRCPGRVGVVSMEQNCGKAEAVRRGMLHAFALQPSFVAYFDADLATPLDQLVGMRALFDANPDLLVVYASRVALLGRDVKRSAARHWLGRVFATAASVSLGLVVYDTQCGAKLFRNTGAVRSLFECSFSTRWVFDVEILARLSALSARDQVASIQRVAVEYPITRWYDVAGSKLTPRAAVRAGFELGRLWLEYRNGWRPRGRKRCGGGWRGTRDT